MTTRTEPVIAGDEALRAASLDAVIHHIIATHHDFLKAELPRLAGLIDGLDTRGGTVAEIASVFTELHAELDAHLMKEEMVLFPLVRSLEEAAIRHTAAPPSHCGSVRNPLRVMTHEHNSARTALDALRRLTSDYRTPAGAPSALAALYTGLEALEVDLLRHIHVEDDILFPRAIAVEDSL